MDFDFDPEELKKQQADAARSKALLGMAGVIGDALSSGQSFGNFYTGKMNAPNTTASKMAAAASDAISDPYEEKKREYEMGKVRRESQEAKRADARSTSMRDPNSEASKAAKAFWLKRGYEVGDTDNAESLAERYGKSADITKIEYENRVKPKGQTTEYQQFLMEMRRRDQQRDAEAAQAKRQQGIDDRVTKLSDKVAPMQTIMNTFNEVDAKLGFDLDTYDPKSNRAINAKTGKDEAVDLPGVSMPLLGRVGFYDKKARGVDDVISRVFNVELKDRSGAAVTSQELQRLQAEFSSGKFNTEEEKLDALQRYKRAAMIAMENAERGFADDVRNEYAARDGQLSKDFKPKPRMTARPEPGQKMSVPGLDTANAGEEPYRAKYESMKLGQLEANYRAMKAAQAKKGSK